MKLKQLITIGALTLASITSKAQVSDFLVKMPYNISSKEILAEPTVTYNLPLGVSGFTFVDLYKGGYFGQTDLTKEINKINIRSRTIHDNELHTKSGVGLNKDFSFFDDKIYLSMSFLPIWFDNEGFLKRQTVDYFFNVDFGKGWSANGFGEWQLQDNKINWVYGEFDLGKNIKKTRISYSPAIVKNEDKKGSKLEHRFAFTYSF